MEDNHFTVWKIAKMIIGGNHYFCMQIPNGQFGFSKVAKLGYVTACLVVNKLI